ncbi:hypothetical protein [Saccharibacter floricola]|uniref:Uncharacterized protein n=1 Tax=Saccharibacter floricola DSM 15669 TaxID=1123227 RepID=A0ABQ0P121_9PROT|nr:hypothetical protein [Saccharibacter floricola]GBQ08785.1 hypothetical protein AA15669_1908 [Saccharibacter floricola DSM 15669]
MVGHLKMKHMFCAVGFLLGSMVSNGARASDLPSGDDADEIKYRIINAFNNGGSYALRKEVLECYHRNMPSFAGMENDMAKQRDAIRKSIGLKYCVLEYEKAGFFIRKDEREESPPKRQIAYWFYNHTAYQSTGLYERLIFWGMESQQHFMGDLFIRKIDMWP